MQPEVNTSEARHRLEVLVCETMTEEHRSIRRLSAADRFAIIVVLRELHRMNQVTNQQRQTIDNAKARKK